MCIWSVVIYFGAAPSFFAGVWSLFSRTLFLVLVFQFLSAEGQRIARLGKIALATGKEKIPVTKLNWLKGRSGEAVRSISDRNRGRQAPRADLAISLRSLRKPLCSGRGEISMVRWRNPTMKSEVEKVSEVEGKKLPGSVTSAGPSEVKTTFLRNRKELRKNCFPSYRHCCPFPFCSMDFIFFLFCFSPF